MSQPITVQALQAPAAVTAAASAVGVAVVDNTVYWLGVPLPVVLAALCGSAVVLSVLGSMTRVQAFGAVALGTAAGTYLPKLIGWKWGVPADVWPAVGFAVAAAAHLGMTALVGAAPAAVVKFFESVNERIRGGGGKP